MLQGESIGIKAKDIGGLIADIKTGLPVGALTLLSNKLGVPEKRIAAIVDIPQRTLTKRKKEGRFKPDESERVFRVARIYERALDVFDHDDDMVKSWLNTSLKGLGDQTPLSYADTEVGARAVEDLLGRIEEGVFY